MELRAAFVAWLRANEAALAPFRARRPGPIEDAFAHDNQLHRLLGAEGWTAYGWPEEAGGRGGSALLRAILYDELIGAGYIVPEAFNVLETIGPMLCTYAPHLAREEMTAFAAGRRMWSQGFSEPDAGSDMASIRTRAVLDGDVFRINGQKIWVSFGHLSDACGVLVRTGDVESRHRGLSILWVDMTLPGVTVRPIQAASGRHEFAELFFDDVAVPRSCLVGELNGGWAVAMHLLQFERGMYGWIRQAWLHRRLEDGLRSALTDAPASPGMVGEAYLAALSLRLRCRATVERLADGAFLGPEISVDKLLLSTAEQQVFDTARTLLGPGFAVSDDPAAADWRSEWFFSRSTSIYGGAAEVQRDIVAEHLLGLPKGR
ncbi:MAG TPA: acyl-CoA dehydrogenase family protein [Acidimicrobiia bacterium]|nr:acyl-CoA dehydrogenase family protein [Acidimicrobiia bacterium]